MFKIFSKAKKQATASSENDTLPIVTAQPIPSDGRTIRFDPNLVSALTDDHKSLVQIYVAIGNCVADEEFSFVPNLLRKFKTSFQSHVIKENVKFYVFLEQSLAEDEHSLVVVKDFRREMNAIASKVITFCNFYANTELTSNNLARFNEEYVQIKDALLHRIEREENDLYSLYHE